MARDGMDLDGVASFHGGLTTDAPARPGAVKAKILVLHGAEDRFISPEQIEEFRKEMKAAGADLRFVSFPGAAHSFTNPRADDYAKRFNLPLGYNAEADAGSWEEMKGFFKEIFGK
jgi:dienelactone hydrolase